jgi:hypothetical protein
MEWYAGFRDRTKEGVLVRRHSKKGRLWSRSIWKIIKVHVREGLSPLLDLEMVDTGTGPPKKKYVSHKYPAECCQVVEDQ